MFSNLPNSKFLDWSKLKALADKINVTEKLKLNLGRAENILGKGEYAGYQHFPTIFSKGLYLSIINSRDCVVKGKMVFYATFNSISVILQ